MNIHSLKVNGAARSCDAEPERTLLSVLRDDLGLTGTKYGCGEGQCGACMVWIDGAPARSCLTRVGAVGTKAVTTIEALEADGKLHPLQQAFLDEDAFQCGYCTSGMLMSGAALLARNPKPSDEEIVSAMNGNICRCGTYPRIIRAMNRAAALNGGAR